MYRDSYMYNEEDEREDNALNQGLSRTCPPDV